MLKVDKIYIAEKQVRPKINHNTEWSYDFAGKSLADFVANWWYDIIITPNSTYKISSSWVQVTSSANDKGFGCVVQLPDLTDATKLTLWQNWYYILWSWSNEKELQLISEPTWDNIVLTFIMRMNNNSDIYKYQEILDWSNTRLVGESKQLNTWIHKTELVLDFTNKTATANISWTDTATYTCSLSDTLITTIRQQALYFNVKVVRWYSSYNDEYLQSMWYKVEY